MSVYSASKFALEGASEALYYEVRPWNIHVTLVQPGFINSDAIERISYTDRSRSAHDNHASPYHAHYQYMARFIAGLMKRSLSTPDSVARRIEQLIRQKRPPLRASATLDAFLFSMLRRLLPRGLYHEILYRSLPGISHWGR
jgi:NAD(P)-dependent dehydrogenase (short-subunit alcohol dehydrogenase family)